jgi:hypothetical protein
MRQAYQYNYLAMLGLCMKDQLACLIAHDMENRSSLPNSGQINLSYS